MMSRPGPAPSRVERAADRVGASSTTGLVLTLLFLGTVNSLGVYAVITLLPARAWAGLAAAVVTTVLIDVVYLMRRALPLRFLVPGMVVLVVFQAYPVLYTGYVAFTNYGTGNILTREQAIERLVANSVRIPDDAVRFPMTVLVDLDDEVALLVTDPEGRLLLGTEDGLTLLRPQDVVGEGRGVEVLGRYRALRLGEVEARREEVFALRVPLDDGTGSAIGAQSFSVAAIAIQGLLYDAAAGVLIEQATGTVFRAVDGTFVADDGRRLLPGYREVVGFANFSRVLTSPAIRGPFLRVFLWTFTFAVLSVATTFAVGLALALALDDPRLRFRRLTRSVLLVPYALPSFMTALIWAGLLNTTFGPVNRLLGVSIPWLTSTAYAGALPKASVLLVNLWLGFPYMFLICSGALQSIPASIKEAASVDGAGPTQTFRRITLPLLLVSVGPLLIASFAFNFNNFNVVYLLTRGGPPIAGTPTPAGHTDILISYSYRLAFEGGRGSDFGLAAAVSTLIFILVAFFSWLGFTRTAVLEEVNR
jgi:arabinogalactan oligomer / maltooligosaccharide transport system permease protein